MTDPTRDDTLYALTEAVEGEDRHALHFSMGRKWTFWRVCDQVDVVPERVSWGHAEDVTCEACQEAGSRP